MDEKEKISAVLQEASQAMDSGDYQKAFELTRRACDLQPKNARLWITAGTLSGQIGELEGAEHCLRKALALAPDSTTALENLSVTLVSKGEAEKALQYATHAILLNPAAKTLDRRGYILAQLGRHDEAIRDFREALDANPKLAGAHNNLGVSLQAIGAHEEAFDSFSRTIALEPKHADAWNNKGLACQALGKLEQALAAHRQAVELNPQHSSALAELAATLERSNQVGEARSAAGRALEIEPDQRKASLVLAVLDRRDGNLDSAEARCRALLSNAENTQEKGELSLELAQCLDKLGRYDEAFGLFERGQKLLLESWHSKPEKQAYLEQIEANGRWPHPSGPTARSNSVQEYRTPAFLVGFPRSGTTLTASILDAHAAISASDEQPLIPSLMKFAETTLGIQPGSITTDQRAALASEYWRMVEENDDLAMADTLFLDKLPLNITRLGFIRQVFPQAKIIVALRDPRDVCLSAFMQSFKPNPAMVHFTNLSDTAKLYCKVMKTWLAIRNSNLPGVFESSYESLIDNFETSTKELLEFLGLEWTEDVGRFHEKTRSAYLSTPSYQAISEPIYQSARNRWKNYREPVKQITPVLAGYLSAFGYTEKTDSVD
ncbi:MAG: tetratricopeptide repeat protein [Gammaproteobacteria bacterium]|nr:tetratricopeptide repeat protein [Gammaproteobacteria bacterium]